MKIFALFAILPLLTSCATGPSPAVQEMITRQKERVGGANLYKLGDKRFRLDIGVGFANSPEHIRLSRDLVAGHICKKEFNQGFKVTGKRENYTQVFALGKLRDAGMTRIFVKCTGKPRRLKSEYVVIFQPPVKLSSKKEAGDYQEVSIYPKGKEPERVSLKNGSKKQGS